MYGYAVSGAEGEGSAFANLTGNPVPSGFSQSIIFSLLFGSLISATDPGKNLHARISLQRGDGFNEDFFLHVPHYCNMQYMLMGTPFHLCSDCTGHLP